MVSMCRTYRIVPWISHHWDCFFLNFLVFFGGAPEIHQEKDRGPFWLDECVGKIYPPRKMNTCRPEKVTISLKESRLVFLTHHFSREMFVSFRRESWIFWFFWRSWTIFLDGPNSRWFSFFQNLGHGPTWWQMRWFDGHHQVFRFEAER